MSKTWYIRIKPIRDLTKKEEEKLIPLIGVALSRAVDAIEHTDFKVGYGKSKNQLIIESTPANLAEVNLMSDEEIKEI